MILPSDPACLNGGLLPLSASPSAAGGADGEGALVYENAVLCCEGGTLRLHPYLALFFLLGTVPLIQ